jgi:hypothetical protein
LLIIAACVWLPVKVRTKPRGRKLTTNRSSQDGATIKYECCDLLIRFYRHLDRREYDELSKLMTEDGTWRRRDGITRGGDEMRRTLSKRSPSLMIVHVLSGLTADIKQPDHVVVHGYMTVYRDENGATAQNGAKLDGPSSIIGIEAECRRIGGDWFIASIDNTWLFKA